MIRVLFWIAAVALITTNPAASLAQAQNPYLAQVDFMETASCPTGTLPADGRFLTARQNTALFVVIGEGKLYGGDETKFALPNLQPLTDATGVKRIPCIWVMGRFPAKPKDQPVSKPPSTSVIYMATDFCPDGTEPAVMSIAGPKLTACNVMQAAVIVPRPGPPPHDLIYLAGNFCPIGSQSVLPQYRFTDVYGDIFEDRLVRFSVEDGFLVPCKLESADAGNRQRYMTEIFRSTSNSAASCPRGSVAADGRKMPIPDIDLSRDRLQAPLYAYLGTIWGGDGRTTFGLPNLKLKTGEGGGIFCIVIEGPSPPRP